MYTRFPVCTLCTKLVKLVQNVVSDLYNNSDPHLGSGDGY